MVNCDYPKCGKAATLQAEALYGGYMLCMSPVPLCQEHADECYVANPYNIDVSDLDTPEAAN